jgi:hypothetical protein
VGKGCIRENLTLIFLDLKIVMVMQKIFYWMNIVIQLRR